MYTVHNYCENLKRPLGGVINNIVFVAFLCFAKAASCKKENIRQTMVNQ